MTDPARVLAVLVIDGTERHTIDASGLVPAGKPWEFQHAALMRHVQGLIARSAISKLTLAASGTVLVSWRAVRHVEILPAAK